MGAGREGAMWDGKADSSDEEEEEDLEAAEKARERARAMEADREAGKAYCLRHLGSAEAVRGCGRASCCLWRVRDREALLGRWKPGRPPGKGPGMGW